MPVYALARFAQAAQPEAGAGELTTNSDIVRLVADASPLAKVVLLILLIFSAASWGIILYKFWTFRRAERQTATFLGVFRKSSKFSEVQAVCPGLPGEPARRSVPVGVCRAERAAARLAARAAAKAVAGRRTSYTEEPGRGRSGVAARDDSGDDEAREPRAVSGDDGERHALHRAVRHRVGDHELVPEHQRDRFVEPATVGPGIAEALIATAAGLFAAIPAVYLLQPLHEPGEALQQRDGRLLARVPEHLGAELHVERRPARAAATAPAASTGSMRVPKVHQIGWTGRPARARARASAPRWPRSTSCRSSTSCSCCSSSSW